MVRVSELRNREVVNINDGRRLGLISDLEVDIAEGCVRSIIIPSSTRVLFLWGKRQEHVIPWEKIIKLGIDTILVDHPVDFLE